MSEPQPELVCGSGADAFLIHDNAVLNARVTRWYNADGDLTRRVIQERWKPAFWSNPITGKTVPYTQTDKITTVLAVPGDFDSATETTVGENIYTDPVTHKKVLQQHRTRRVRRRRHARLPGRTAAVHRRVRRRRHVRVRRRLRGARVVFVIVLTIVITSLALASAVIPEGSRTTAGSRRTAPGEGSSKPSVPSGTEVSVWSSASSSSASRSAVTAHGVATDSLDLPCLAATGRGSIGIWKSPPLIDRFHVLRYVAVTGAEGASRGRLRPAPGGVGAIRPSRPRARGRRGPGGNVQGNPRGPRRDAA